MFVDLYRFNKGLGMKINSKKYTVFVAHNPKVVGSNPAPATSIHKASRSIGLEAFLLV
jgi:hypothetical protein